MSPLLAAPLLLTLLTDPSAPVWPASEKWDMPGARRLELTAESAKVQHPVDVSPRHSTHLVFDTPLQPGGVEVDERWVKKAVNEAEGMVMLRLAGVPPPDEPLTVTVRFAEAQGLERVTFRLRVHPIRGEHEVQVIRQPGVCASSNQEARQQRERAERCEAARERERTGPEAPRPEGFSDFVDAGLVGDGAGIVGRKLALGRDFSQRPGETLVVWEAYSYRVERRGLVAAELHVDSTDTRPWVAEGAGVAELVNEQGVRLKVVRVWQPEPLVAGTRRLLVVEAEATVAQARGSFRLELGEAEGARTLTVRGVTFP
ncbi:DUF2381 family protein [Archangium lansingense]|uniref:DUF2381 family protein n=1 Tax=Archangium lansingense TaxID=2995310 RepID=A0ABT4AK56_9BACT|nr:DUF2381 family protein [Archangium lansinium]MCY1082015.1 DUF2381 family protein [Archangium lansinium]